MLAYYDSIYVDEELSHRAKMVYIYLKDHTNKEGTCWPGINTIAAGVSLSRSTVKWALDDLTEAGLMEKTSRRRGNAGKHPTFIKSSLKILHLFSTCSSG